MPMLSRCSSNYKRSNSNVICPIKTSAIGYPIGPLNF
jgi:hypothetical protein